jgi:hypothetical protein
MTRTTVSVDGRSVVVSSDGTLRYRAVAVGRVASEIAGMPAPRASVSTVRSDVRPFVRDADFCLAADPARSFPTSSSFDVTIGADGFLPRTTTVTVDPASLPAALGTIELRPLPVRVQGRVVAADTGDALASARVHAIDDPTVGSPPPVHTIVLDRPLARAHPSAAPLEEATVSSASGLGALPSDAPAGSTALRLAGRTGLAPGAVVAIGGDDAELARVEDPGPAPLADAGVVTLRDPLTRTLRAGAAVALLEFGGTGTVTALAEPSEPGGAVVVAEAAVGGLVRIEPGPDEEYRRVGVLADDAGYYRVDGLAHVASLWLAADAPGRQRAHRAVTVRYGTPVTVVDFQLKP